MLKKVKKLGKSSASNKSHKKKGDDSEEAAAIASFDLPALPPKPPKNSPKADDRSSSDDVSEGQSPTSRSSKKDGKKAKKDKAKKKGIGAGAGKQMSKFSKIGLKKMGIASKTSDSKVKSSKEEGTDGSHGGSHGGSRRVSSAGSSGSGAKTGRSRSKPEIPMNSSMEALTTRSEYLQKLEIQKTSYNIDRESQESELLALRNRLIEVEAKLTEELSKNVEYEEEIKGLKLSIAALETDRNTDRATIETERSKHNYQVDYEDLKRQFDELQTAKGAVDEELEASHRRLDESAKKLALSQKELEGVRKDGLQQENSQHQTEIKGMKDRILELEERLREDGKLLSTRELELKQKERELREANLKADGTQSSSEASSDDQEIMNLQAELDGLKGKYQVLILENEKLKSEHESLTILQEEYAMTAKGVNEELEESKIIMSELKAANLLLEQHKSQIEEAHNDKKHHRSSSSDFGGLTALRLASQELQSPAETVIRDQDMDRVVMLEEKLQKLEVTNQDLTSQLNMALEGQSHLETRNLELISEIDLANSRLLEETDYAPYGPSDNSHQIPSYGGLTPTGGASMDPILKGLNDPMSFSIEPNTLSLLESKRNIELFGNERDNQLDGSSGKMEATMLLEGKLEDLEAQNRDLEAALMEANHKYQETRDKLEEALHAVMLGDVKGKPGSDSPYHSSSSQMFVVSSSHHSDEDVNQQGNSKSKSESKAKVVQGRSKEDRHDLTESHEFDHTLDKASTSGSHTGRLDGGEREIARLTAEAARLSQEIEDILHQKAALERDNEEILKEKNMIVLEHDEEIRRIMKEFKDEKKLVEEENHRVIKENSELLKQHEAISTKKSQDDDALTHRDVMIKRHEGERAELLAKLNLLGDDIKAGEVEKQKLEDLINTYRVDIRQLKSEIDSEREKSKELTGELEHLEEKNEMSTAAANQRVEDLTAEVSAARGVEDVLKSKLQHYEELLSNNLLPPLADYGSQSRGTFHVSSASEDQTIMSDASDDDLETIAEGEVGGAKKKKKWKMGLKKPKFGSSSKKSDNQSAKVEVKQLRAALEKKEEKLVLMESHLESLTEELPAEKQRLEDAWYFHKEQTKQERDGIEKDKKALAALKDEWESRLAVLKEQLEEDHQTNSIVKLEAASLDKLQEKITSLERDLEVKEANLGMIGGILKDQGMRDDSISGVMSFLSMKFNTFSNTEVINAREKESLQEEIQAAVLKLTSVEASTREQALAYEDTIAKKQAEIKRVEGQLQDAQDDKARLTKNIDKVTETLDDLKASHEKEKEKEKGKSKKEKDEDHKETSVALRRAEASIKELESLVERQKSELASRMQKIEDMDEEIVHLKLKIENLVKAKDDTSDVNRNARNELEEARRMIEDLKHDKRAAVDKSNTLKMDMKELEYQPNSLRSKRPLVAKIPQKVLGYTDYIVAMKGEYRSKGVSVKDEHKVNHIPVPSNISNKEVEERVLSGGTEVILSINSTINHTYDRDTYEDDSLDISQGSECESIATSDLSPSDRDGDLPDIVLRSNGIKLPEASVVMSPRTIMEPETMKLSSLYDETNGTDKTSVLHNGQIPVHQRRSRIFRKGSSSKKVKENISVSCKENVPIVYKEKSWYNKGSRVNNASSVGKTPIKTQVSLSERRLEKRVSESSKDYIDTNVDSGEWPNLRMPGFPSSMDGLFAKSQHPLDHLLKGSNSAKREDELMLTPIRRLSPKGPHIADIGIRPCEDGLVPCNLFVPGPKKSMDLDSEGNARSGLHWLSNKMRLITRRYPEANDLLTPMCESSDSLSELGSIFRSYISPNRMSPCADDKYLSPKRLHVNGRM